MLVKGATESSDCHIPCSWHVCVIWSCDGCAEGFCKGCLKAVDWWWCCRANKYTMYLQMLKTTWMSQIHGTAMVSHTWQNKKSPTTSQTGFSQGCTYPSPWWVCYGAPHWWICCWRHQTWCRVTCRIVAPRCVSGRRTKWLTETHITYSHSQQTEDIKPGSMVRFSESSMKKEASITMQK